MITFTVYYSHIGSSYSRIHPRTLLHRVDQWQDLLLSGIDIRCCPVGRNPWKAHPHP